MEMSNWTDWGSASDAAAASNTASSGASWWDAIANIGGKVVEYGVKKAIDKEFNTNLVGNNQQPIVTAAPAPSPLSNALPVRGFASNMPNYIQEMDMKPFLILGAAFVVVLILVMSFGRK